MAAGSVEVDCAWNNDFSLSPNGDLVLAQDSTQGPTATTQRLIRLLLTTPTLYSQYGTFLAPPDDIFHPSWGAGLRAAVSGAFSEANLALLRSIILDAMSNDFAVATDPPPVVNLTLLDPQTAILNVTFTTVTGQVVPLPTITLTPDGT